MLQGSTGNRRIFLFNKWQGGVIEELLKSENLTEKFIVDSDKDKASVPWNKCKKNNKDINQGKDEWKLPDWNSKQSGDTLPKSLVDKCNEKRRESVSIRKDDKYAKFKRWCLKQ
ncbi:hypothetical protein A6V39_03425 [Candidatus Mycoplasma haematobovis]|uniref:Uncharacterized protein n=1 Tax=Candidatus Mycoplasma haematobovis TaxID=432608 RepID=A0A1A9QD99_9MOLU|nr:hypothetical protein [Candidatus Mycoplasma haematobovis]OAL09936.1 hypothetical protein A6V39_03425 [Candidatus Mycoplasma haematobovis]